MQAKKFTLLACLVFGLIHCGCSSLDGKIYSKDQVGDRFMSEVLLYWDYYDHDVSSKKKVKVYSERNSSAKEIPVGTIFVITELYPFSFQMHGRVLNYYHYIVQFEWKGQQIKDAYVFENFVMITQDNDKFYLSRDFFRKISSDTMK